MKSLVIFLLLFLSSTFSFARVILNDSFDRSNSTDLGNTEEGYTWVKYDSGVASPTISGNSLLFNNGNTIYITNGDAVGSDFIADFIYDWGPTYADPGRYFKFNFRNTIATAFLDKGGVQSGYELRVDVISNTELRVSIYSEYGGTLGSSVVTGGYTYIFGPHDITLRAVGNTFDVFVDDYDMEAPPILSVTDDSANPGKDADGYFAMSMNAFRTCNIDNFKIQKYYGNGQRKLSDSFNRADSTTIGDSLEGYSWVKYDGGINSPEISDQQLYFCAGNTIYPTASATKVCDFIAKFTYEWGETYYDAGRYFKLNFRNDSVGSFLDKGGVQSGYELRLDVTSDTQLRVSIYSEYGGTLVTGTVTGTQDYIFGPHQVILKAVGNAFDVYIDDVYMENSPVVSFIDDSQNPGKNSSGYFALSMNAYRHCSIDNFVIEKLLTRGHRKLIEEGLQIYATMRTFNLTDRSVNVSVWNQSGFTGMNLERLTSYGGYGLPTGQDALNWCIWAEAEAVLTTNVEKLTKLQFLDEQSIASEELPQIAEEIAWFKEYYPDSIIYTNQMVGGRLSISLWTPTELNNYVQSCKPDMLSQTEYPFYWQISGGVNTYVGGSPTYTYQRYEMYRQAGLAGLDGTGDQPIPVSHYVQLFAHATAPVTTRPSSSEYILQQFAGWTMGFKAADAFTYNGIPDSQISLIFDDNDDNTPNQTFYDYAELNEESLNLGKALVYLITTDFRMKMGKHAVRENWWEVWEPLSENNTLPSGVSSWSSTANEYITDITVTNLGLKNKDIDDNALPGDVLIGFFKVIDPIYAHKGHEDDVYFMVTNGLSDRYGTTGECAQSITIYFDFDSSGITQLLEVDRETGEVQEVPLVYDGGTEYHLTITLDGGKGNLYKFDTGHGFIDVEDLAIVVDD